MGNFCQIFPHEVCELMGVLTRGRDADRARPVEIQVSQLIGQLLKGGCSCVPDLVQDACVQGWCDGPLKQRKYKFAGL